MSAQSTYKKAGDLTADDIGKGIWCAIRTGVEHAMEKFGWRTP